MTVSSHVNTSPVPLNREPLAWRTCPGQAEFWQCLASSKDSVLMLDYDGTLAPFHSEKMKALPYPGVENRLERIISLPHTRLVLISGRRAQEIPQLLPVASRVQIWGSHGMELQSPDGSYRRHTLSAAQHRGLSSMAAVLMRSGYFQVLEWKPSGLAVHWRLLDATIQHRLSSLAEVAFQAYAAGLGLAQMPFDGGMEYCLTSRNKGSVVREIVAEMDSSATLAYLGDDTTDENAFIELQGRGSSWLVRPEVRGSAADFWLTPPEELLAFLDTWIHTLSF